MKQMQIEAGDVQEALIGLMGSVCERCGEVYDDGNVLERCELAMQGTGSYPQEGGFCGYCEHMATKDD